MALGLLMSVLMLACRKEVPPPPDSELAPAPSSPDRLPRGELLEGDTRIFGVPLPVDATVEAAFRWSASARGPWSPEDLAAYLKPRLVTDHVEIAGRKILFPRARVRAGGDTILRIEVDSFRGGAILHLRDITPPPVQPNLTEEERWRAVGMTPDGRLLDPHGME